MGIASRVTQRTPQRFTTVKSATRMIASRGMGTLGKYHSAIAVADKMAVRPQVGTQPHQ